MDLLTGPFGPLIAFLAGLVSVVSPCVLPMVPAYIGHLTGAVGPDASGSLWRNGAFRHAASFVAGFSLVFIALGASLGLMGFILQDYQPLMQRGAGALIILLGLQMAHILRIPGLYRTYQLQVAGGNGSGYLRSFLVGSAFSIGWTPCVGPLLASILALAAASGTVWQGSYLLAFYSLGLSIPFLSSRLSFGAVVPYYRALGRYLPVIEVAGGLILIVVGIFIYLDRLTFFNRFFDFGVTPNL